MSLAEYLYVDERRLNSYFEQISSPINYDKVPVWKAGLSLTGPIAEGQQARFARPFSRHEKIVRLAEHINSNKEVQRVLRTISCPATRIVIPPNEKSPEFKGLAVWIVARNYYEAEENCTLCLLEDYRKDDDYSNPMEMTSGWSALTLFLSEMEESWEKTILKTEISDQEWWTAREELEKDPLTFFSKLGAQVTRPRQILAIYRNRTSTHRREWNSEREQWGADYSLSIGYPIVITDAS